MRGVVQMLDNGAGGLVVAGFHRVAGGIIIVGAGVLHDKTSVGTIARSGKNCIDTGRK